jgi:hypothetical protein
MRERTPLRNSSMMRAAVVEVIDRGREELEVVAPAAGGVEGVRRRLVNPPGPVLEHRQHGPALGQFRGPGQAFWSSVRLSAYERQ